jgi:hypothetical protein
VTARQTGTDRGVRTAWSHPRTWRQHELGSERYWVEDEVEVVVDGVPVEHLSWPAPLSDDERRAYDLALQAKWVTLA